MAAITATVGLTWTHPMWLLLCALIGPILWLSWRYLEGLGRVRRVLALTLRCLVVMLLAAILAQPLLTRTNEQVTVITVLDRSQSVPQSLETSALGYLDAALAAKPPRGQLALVDVAEAAVISKLPSSDATFRHRNTSLSGLQTRLSSGLDMALAIAPPDSANRILLISDGNETSGDIRRAARTAAANGIPIDVLPLRYSHTNEVVLSNLSAPVKARSGQTIPLRFVLKSTAPARGKLLLTLNGKPVALGEGSAVEAPIELTPGTNVKTISLPVGQRGIHEFKATFIPSDPSQDSLEPNNHATAITMVSGPGHVLLVDDGKAGDGIVAALNEARIETRRISAEDFPTDLINLLDCDGLILVNTSNSLFSQQQQELICRYVNQTGGGLVMVGGPDSFGAGGWIGSPVADILPVELDPPQKRQLPKGALVLIMHACEMPDGNYWGKKVASAAVNSLSQLDLAGVLQYGWQDGTSNWVYPFGPLSDKSGAMAAIAGMQMGDMPAFGPPMSDAYLALVDCDAASKHVIIISDGDPQRPPAALIRKFKEAKITCSGVAIFPHSPADTASLADIAQSTGGRFYYVKDPESLPQIFIREAQVVRRPLIVEEPIQPTVQFGIHEILRGVDSLPGLDGQVLTAAKGGLAQMILSTQKGDPLLAAGQSGLGRTVVFTSSADARWAKAWLAWGGYNRFWEQVVRWAGKPAQSTDLDVLADVQGRQVSVSVESSDAQGKSNGISQVAGQVIAPDLSTRELALEQVGPGKYRGDFQADAGGSYLLVLRYRQAGGQNAIGLIHTAISVPFAPEFRDVADNAALLIEVAAMTGGRVLSADPAGAKLFDAAGMKFPKTALPLMSTLLLVWLGLFLADVAVRRIALDVPGMLRKLATALATIRRGAHSSAQTLEQLKSRKAAMRQQWAARQKSPSASVHYEASARAGGELPTEQPAASQAPAPAGKPEPPAKPKPAQENTSHLQQLLNAKRKASPRRPADGPSSDHSSGQQPPGEP